MYTSPHTHAHTQDCTSNLPSTLFFLPLLIWINNTMAETNLSFTHVNTYIKVWLSSHLGSGSLSPNNSDKLFICGASLSWVLTACKQAHLQLREGTLFSDNSNLFYRNYKVPKERFFFFKFNVDCLRNLIYKYAMGSGIFFLFFVCCVYNKI